MKTLKTCTFVSALAFAAGSANAALVVAADYTFDGATPVGATLNGDATISGGSLNLDGAGDYLSIASPMTATDNFAIEATFTITALPGFSFVAYNGADDNDHGAGIVQIGSDIGGIAPGVANLDGDVAATSNVAMTYSLVRQGGEWTSFVNGVEIDITGTDIPGSSIDTLLIGAGLDSDGVAEGFFSGSIDRVRLSTFDAADELGVDQDGYITVIPEPGSLALLAAGGLCILRRRR